MFTGIVAQLGQVLEHTPQVQGCRLVIKTRFEDIQAGESIAVNGVCLTALPTICGGIVEFDLSQETLTCSNLSNLKAEDYVNIERAMRACDRFGGHYVSGHVDKTVTIQSMVHSNGFIEMTLGPFTTQDMQYLMPKGSITIEGVSLTINAIIKHAIQVCLVPHTIEQTTLKDHRHGYLLNVEFDYMAKLVAHMTKPVIAHQMPVH